jgi:ribosomal protein L3 glutamine methyltransferase
MRGSEPSADAVAAAVEALGSPEDFVCWGARRFSEHGLHFGHGTDNARDEARWLVLHALGLDPQFTGALPQLELSRDQREAVAALIERRIASRKPAAYLTGTAWFAGLKFYVDERVLVPRSPIAEWIERAFEPFLDPARVSRILDLGTGCGCIAVALALAFAEAQVDASDVSPAALQVARINVEAHGLTNRVRLIQSDAFDGLREKYDLIVSNPPYVPEPSFSKLPQEYRHEPAGGLVAGSEGLDVISRIIREAPRFLLPKGLLVVEAGEAREALESRYPELPFLWLEMTGGGDDVFALSKEELT